MVLDVFVTHWIAVVPVKAFPAAKSRLDTVPPLERAGLAQAMALDTLAAITTTPQITSTVVVQDGDMDFPTGNWQVITGPGAGLNAAIALAARSIARRESPSYAIAVITADLPCLDAESLSSILDSAERFPLSLVSDTCGTGTTMLLARDGSLIPDTVQPQFGHHSCAAHVASGAVNLGNQHETSRRALNRARRDVDTAVDLWDALRIGVGPHTRAIH